MLNTLLVLAAFTWSGASAQDSDGDNDGTPFTLFMDVNPSPVEVCGTATINYRLNATLITPQPVNLTIAISAADGSSSSILTNAAIVSNDSWYWAPVAVPAGQYILNAVDTFHLHNIGGISAPFFIAATQGGDESCLSTTDPTQTTSTSSSTTDSTGSSMSNTDTNPSTTGSSSSTTSTNSQTATPVSGISHSHVSTGVKAGVSVVGALLFIAGIIALVAFFLNRRRRRSAYLGAARRVSSFRGGATFGDEPTNDRRWNGLASRDDYEATGYTGREAKNDPLGRSFNANTDGASSELNEKPDGLTTYPPLDTAGIVYLPSSPRSDKHPVTRSSSGSSVAARDRVDSSELRRYSGSSSINAPPLTPVPMAASGDPVRRSKGATARKPVPSYAPSETNHEARRSSSLIDPFASPSASSDIHTPHDSGLLVEPQFPGLQHKSSFEKPMSHVLIPDMPPPRVDSPPARHSR